MLVRAAIDIGTNTVRLLVAQIENGKPKDLIREARITRLGQGVDKTGLLSAEAISRTIKVLEKYKADTDLHKATEVKVGATSAARDAKNLEEFITSVKERTGLKIEVLNPEQEASFSFFGASACLENLAKAEDKALVLDIGGGSTELTLGNWKNKHIDLDFSKDIGSVRFTELFIKNDPPKESELNDASKKITALYQEPVDKIKTTAQNFQMIGTAGIVTILAAINLGLEKYESEKVHCSSLSLVEIENIFSKLKILTVKERKQIKVIQPGRADVIVMGTLILLTITKLLGVKSILVSENDILDGLLMSVDN